MEEQQWEKATFSQSSHRISPLSLAVKRCEVSHGFPLLCNVFQTIWVGSRNPWRFLKKFNHIAESPSDPCTNVPACNRSSRNPQKFSLHCLPQPAKVVTDLRMDLLQGAEKGHKRWSSKVGDGTQACEQAPVEDLLEVTFTDVLERDQPIIRTELLDIWKSKEPLFHWGINH